MVNRKRYFNEYFWRILVRFMVIPAVLFLVIVPVTIGAENLIYDSLVNTAEKDLEVSSQNIEADLLRLVQQAQTIGKNVNVSALTRLSNEEFEAQNLLNCYKLYQSQKYFSENSISSRIAQNYYILSQRNDLLLSQGIVSKDASKLYGNLFQVEGYTYEEWREELFQGGGQYRLLPAREANMVFDSSQLKFTDQVIHLVVPLSVSSGTADKVFVFMLDAEQVCSEFRLDRYGEGSWVAVVDPSGEMLGAEQLEGGGLTSIERTLEAFEGTKISFESDRTGCTITLGISEQYFGQLLFPVKVIMWSVVVWLFVVVVVIAAMLAYRQSKSVTNMVETAEETISQSRTQNPFQYIVDVLEELDTQRRQYGEEVRMMNRTLRDVLLGRLLDGKIYTPRELERCRSVLELSEGGSYCCACVHILQVPETATLSEKLEISSRASACLRNLFAQKDGYRCQLYIGEPLAPELLISGEGDSFTPETLQVDLEGAVQTVWEETGLELSVGLGPTVTTLEKLGWSAKCAHRALHGREEALSVRVFQESGDRHAPVFSLQDAQKLSELLASGEKEYTKSFIESIAKRAVGRGCPSEEEVAQVYFAMRMAIESAAGALLHSGKEVSLPEYQPDSSLEKIVLSFWPSCSAFFEILQSRQQAAHSKKQLQILEYIQQHYADSSLCAAAIAEVFHVSEKYVFQVVKSLTGKTLGCYIEEQRLKMAEELLAQNVDINDIPLQIGYTSVNTFYKAFKRVYQMSPGRWRASSQMPPDLGEVGAPGSGG
ncbi:MAG: helix-turn-helix domain-containing protein [Acutalibacter sp.]|jgi:AraC-like DNA-binding protein